MSIRAGSIVTVGGRNVIDRLQTAGLGDARIPVETIYEIGNDLAVDKIPTEADFTFSMESWDVSTDLMALLHGRVGTQPANDPPGAADPAGTEYRWEDCEYLNIVSPWKRDTGNQGGHIGAGVLIPGYYPTRLNYRFGVTDWATQTVDLGGGSYFYAEGASPVEEVAVGDAAQVDFVTSEAARAYRKGGVDGTTFKYVFGVLVNGQLQTEDVDYTVVGVAPPAASAPATITFNVAPAAGAQVRFIYFSEVAKTYPQAVNADTIIKPGAVRGRNIDIMVGERGVNQVKLPGVQTFELTATVNSEIEREMGNEEPTGRSVNSTDTTGTVTFRPRDIAHLFDALELVTGVSRDEVYGYFNQNEVPVEVLIRNPKDPGTILKTLYVADGLFQPPGTPARANAPTDFTMSFDSQKGTFSEFKGARP